MKKNCSGVSAQNDIFSGIGAFNLVRLGTRENREHRHTRMHINSRAVYAGCLMKCNVFILNVLAMCLGSGFQYYCDERCVSFVVRYFFSIWTNRRNTFSIWFFFFARWAPDVWVLIEIVSCECNMLSTILFVLSCAYDFPRAHDTACEYRHRRI